MKIPWLCLKRVLSTSPQTRGVRCRVNLRWVLAITAQRSAHVVTEHVRPSLYPQTHAVREHVRPSPGPAETSLSISLPL